MNKNNILFFKKVEDFLLPENILKSKNTFKNSFDGYNMFPILVTEEDDDIVLHFEHSISSWKQNFHIDLECLFDEVLIQMEEAYIKSEISNFSNYVISSVKRISQIDDNRYSENYLKKLFNYFIDKYDLDFLSSPNSIQGLRLKLKHGLKKSELEEIYFLSVDDYIDDTSFDLQDFKDLLDGDISKRIKFKCSTPEMVEYVRNLSNIFEDFKLKNLDTLKIFQSKNSTTLTESNFRKNLSKNKDSIQLSEELKELFNSLNKK